MKTYRTLLMTSSMLVLSSTLALAETTARQDHSQLLVWAFLGMCALIIIIQLMPVVMIAYGLVKGLVKGKEIETAAEVTVDK
jgi:hypothetical protein